MNMPFVLLRAHRPIGLSQLATRAAINDAVILLRIYIYLRLRYNKSAKRNIDKDMTIEHQPRKMTRDSKC